MSGLDFVVRDYQPSDRPLVVDAWLNSIRAANRETSTSDWESFKRHHYGVIERILSRPDTRIRVATPPGDDITVYGFLVLGAPPVVHMCFVKKPFRRQGIARALVAGVEMEGAVATQWTRDLESWVLMRTQRRDGTTKFGKARFVGGLRYDPFWEGA